MSKITSSQRRIGALASRGWSAESGARLKRAIADGNWRQEDMAKVADVSRSTLALILSGKSTPRESTLTRICEVLNIQIDALLDADQGGASAAEVVAVPALNITASAGDGSLAVGEHLRPGPFHFASDWLRNSFGSIAALKLVQVKGDSQEPDLHGGDWVMIDDSRTAIENGLAVVRLDDCLMIKWLQREGHLLRLISRNPQYLPTELDLRRDEARLQVIGRAVFVLKAV